MREREKEERGKDRSKEIGEKIEKGEILHKKEVKGEAEWDRGRGANSKNALSQVLFGKCAITVCFSDSVSAKVDQPVELLRN